MMTLVYKQKCKLSQIDWAFAGSVDFGGQATVNKVI